MRYIYAITEKNVGNTGRDMTEYVSSPRSLMQPEQMLLSQCLTEARKNADDASTDDIINAALELFQQKSGKRLKFDGDPIAGHIEF